MLMLPALPATDSHTFSDTETIKFHDVDTSLTLWNVEENVICRVKSWAEGMELQADTIRAVRDQIPSIPVPEVIYSWLDQAWNRTFLLLTRAFSQRLEDAWPILSTDQIVKVAADLAKHISIMFEFTSPQLKTITGCGVNSEYYLFGDADINTWPLWKPHIRPIFMPETVTTFLHDLGGEDPSRVGDKFYFYHPDMGPTNVFVSVSGLGKEDVQVTTIIDWEAAAYYPRWWLAVKPRVSAGFALRSAQKPELWEWNARLSDAMIDQGFGCPYEWWMRFSKYQRDQYDKLQSEWKLTWGWRSSGRERCFVKSSSKSLHLAIRY